MMLPDLSIADHALSNISWATWRTKMLRLKQTSTSIDVKVLGDDAGQELLAAAEMLIGKELQLLQPVLFRIESGDVTTPHIDFGEYVALYYPWSCPSGPLRLYGKHSQDVQVVANRLVVFNATSITHRQIAPNAEEVRYSVALKFRYP